MTGINLSFTRLLLFQNCNVLLADLALRPEAQELVSSYSQKRDGRARAVFQKTDVTDWNQLSETFETATKEFGGVDIVCPGAGIYDPYFSNFWHPPGSKNSKDGVDGGRYASLDINLTHPIRMTQTAISYFLNPPNSNNGGQQKVSPANPKRVILISSIAGQTSNLNTPIYVAAKHGINGFIRSLADLEPKIGVRINGVAPGVIRTPLWTEHPEKLGFVDEGRDEWVEPEEVAEAMVRCLVDETGEVGGGTVLEVGKGQTRRVEERMDPGPKGRGHTVANLKEGYAEVYQWLGESGWGQV
ncbi:hypothetical protein BCR34DRAFT_491762 [Clohesyomyces aquaticus]|uniref:NAD(P)-binding protein n=1 Tax=Clohesyomyces aquaticus TaxID=1231657 RepID=A0A1Y1Z1N1_9PLEO|nr:hypothetical protein BCR34DRAFT_491762 [Clohesyomyces aquaticus]